MRTRISVLLTVLLTSAAALIAIPAAPAGAALADEQFAAFSTGTAVATNALTLGTTTVAKLGEAHSGSSVDSTGLGTAITDELGQNVQPPLPDKNAYGRGSGLEAGLVLPADQPIDVNQLILSGIAEASAPPPEGVPNPITKTISVDLPPVLTTGLLTGTAQAIYDPNTCAIGQPISYGKGEAADVRLVGAPDTPLVGTTTSGDPTANTVTKSESFSYFIPNPDGSFGLVSETHQLIAPISLLNTVAGPTLTIEVAGEFILRSTATGIPGDPRNGVTYPGNPLITIKGPLGVPLLSINLSSVLGPTGVTIPLGAIGTISLGQSPRAIGGPPGSPVANAPDGTLAAGAVDAIGSISLLAIVPGAPVVDLRLGHMEAAATVPPGGVHCTIPVSKTATPNPATAGQEVTWTINIPSDPAFFAQFFACDLIGIKATDVHSVIDGNPKFEITSADHGGVVNGDTVTWDNLGNYTRGSPPIVLTLKGRIIGGTGTLEDLVDVSATLGNCTGGIAGQAIVGSGQFQNVALTGSALLVGPKVNAGNLAATGGDARYLLLGGLFLLAALDIRRRLHKRVEVKA
ncbi:MAG: hypothetical protein M3137_16805 [Actinomycetota bacterium]|nr:hypothetical protein [Actinomycetota bacterium]